MKVNPGPSPFLRSHLARTKRRNSFFVGGNALRLEKVGGNTHHSWGSGDRNPRLSAEYRNNILF
jgi:hypothetical protein